MKTTYKTSKKYKCPFCDIKASRMELIDHVDQKHEDLIPEDYNAARSVYDFINGKNYGTCMICKAKVYEWNDKINRYNNLCNNPKCREEVRKIALERHIRVYNKPTLLNDAEHQEKMLANRKISGTYTFRDGGKHVYTGTYEKNALEFMDKALDIKSTEIQSPGPVLEYNYNGEVHKWITDIYYIPANLIIEIKDGGSNPNNRSMESYREKQVAKEQMITELGTFNYIRLTNNDFSQLLDIFADMKNEALFEAKPSVKIHINEEVGGLPAHRSPEAYIIPYGMNNTFAGFAYGDSEMDQILTVSSKNKIKAISEDEFESTYETCQKLFYKDNDIVDKINTIHEKLQSGDIDGSTLVFAELLLGRKLRRYEEVLFSENFKYYDEKREQQVRSLIENGIINHSQGEIKMNIAPEKNSFDENVIECIGCVYICRSPMGYYAVTPNEFRLLSSYFSNIESLKNSGVIEIMNDTYINHFMEVNKYGTRFQS